MLCRNKGNHLKKRLLTFLCIRVATDGKLQRNSALNHYGTIQGNVELLRLRRAIAVR